MKLNVFEWVAKSPDLNSVEMLGSIIDKRWAAKPIYTKERLTEESNGVDQQLCLKLIDSISNRIQKCLKVKGGYFM